MAADAMCPGPMKATSQGAFQGENPLDYALPLAILQICLVVVVTRGLAYLLRPLRQPRVIAEIIVSTLPFPPGSLPRYTCAHACMHACMNLRLAAAAAARLFPRSNPCSHPRAPPGSAAPAIPSTTLALLFHFFSRPVVVVLVLVLVLAEGGREDPPPARARPAGSVGQWWWTSPPPSLE
jgi:hypothetical protein